MLKLYNTFTKSLETLESTGSDIKIYLCGPTVQSSPHIGHGRSAVVFDFMVRYIKFSGNSVIFARNITDIDDKIIEKSIEENITYQELGERVTKEFKELIDDLIKKNYGYITKSGVYFDVSKYDSYLELSGRSFDEVFRGTRVNIEEDKKNPEDFALWKISKDNEPSWESPWGNGRPGWHIECSAMIHDIFKGEIDIHCGGNDLIFPHHENERAQSTSAFNHKFVKHWVHNGMINFSGKKMSKSEGNSKFLQEYINNYGGNILRYFFLRANYRKPQEFSEALLEESKATFNNIESLISGVKADLTDSNLETIFIESMNDDLNTPKFLGEMFEYINKNKNGDQTQITNMKSTIKFLFETLGFVFEDNKLTIDNKLLEDILSEQNIEIENDINVSINKFVIKRNDHRKNKEFEIADYMRDRLEEVGIVIEDGNESGWRWKNS
jgi:cysteinyl-tRNA synthetase